MASSSSSSVPDPDFRVLTFRNRHGADASSSRPYQKRKPHTKSRRGCLSCKLRRVKCNQGRPSCDRCLRLASYCVYADEPATTISRPSPALSTVDSLLPSRRSHGTSRPALLHHFFTSFTWPLPCYFEASSLLALGMTQPFLLDALLAVSASHLRHHSVIKQPSRLAEQSQQSLALPGFRAVLERPLDDPDTAEAIVLTALFLNVLFFSAVEDDDDPAKSWIFNRQPGRLAWLSLHLGFKPLLLSTKAFQGKNVLGHAFHLSCIFQYTHLCSEEISLLPVHWQHLLGLDANQGRVFHDPARVAAHLSHVEPTRDNFFYYCKFFAVMDIELRFRDMLEREDERAVWLFGYWLGLMNRFKYWWMAHRVRMEWTAIRIWLHRRGVRSRGGTWIKLMRDLESAAEWPEPAEEEPQEVADTDHVEWQWPLVCQ